MIDIAMYLKKFIVRMSVYADGYNNAYDILLSSILTVITTLHSIL
jgi:hypothetical protein